MLKNGLALLGLILVVAAVAVWLALGSRHTQATALDTTRPPAAPGEGDAPDPCLRAVESTVTLQRRVMAEGDAQALLVALFNTGADSCTVHVTVNAPQFSLSPPETQRPVSLLPQEEVDAAWILRPYHSGVFDVAVSIGGDARVLGITVTNVLGLTPRQAELISLIATFLGPMLTAPWWLERWQAWQRSRAAKAPAGAAKKAEPAVFE